MGKKTKKTPDPFTDTPDPALTQGLAEDAAQAESHNESRAEYTPLTPADPSIPTVAPGIPEQVSGAWNSLLAMATAQGASRGDIVGMTLQTVESVLTLTAGAMWPEGQDLPKEEHQAFGLFQGLVHGVGDARRTLGR